MVVGTHPGLGGWDGKQFIVAIGYSDRGTFDVVKFHQPTRKFVWSSYSLLAANLLGTWPLDFSRFELASQKLPAAALFISDRLYLACGEHLAVFSHQGVCRDAIEFPSPVERLTRSRSWTRQRIVVSLEDGGVMLWGDTSDAPRSRFGEGLGGPYTCLTRGGLLVAAADGVVEVYDTRDTKLTLLAMKAEPSLHPCGLVATDHAEQFAVLSADGTVQVLALVGRR